MADSMKSNVYLINQYFKKVLTPLLLNRNNRSFLFKKTIILCELRMASESNDFIFILENGKDFSFIVLFSFVILTWTQ